MLWRKPRALGRSEDGLKGTLLESHPGSWEGGGWEHAGPDLAVGELEATGGSPLPPPLLLLQGALSTKVALAVHEPCSLVLLHPVPECVAILPSYWALQLLLLPVVPPSCPSRAIS